MRKCVDFTTIERYFFNFQNFFYSFSSKKNRLQCNKDIRRICIFRSQYVYNASYIIIIEKWFTRISCHINPPIGCIVSQTLSYYLLCIVYTFLDNKKISPHV